VFVYSTRFSAFQVAVVFFPPGIFSHLSCPLNLCCMAGNYDIMQQPKNISEASKRSACFYMFVDEETEASIRNSSNLNSTRKIGLWRVVVVRNLPYADARRNGKVPFPFTLQFYFGLFFTMQLVWTI